MHVDTHVMFSVVAVMPVTSSKDWTASSDEQTPHNEDRSYGCIAHDDEDDDDGMAQRITYILLWHRYMNLYIA
eukprot:scaffold111791_cov25-Prasinocladus_malaysianus.AAC.3